MTLDGLVPAQVRSYGEDVLYVMETKELMEFLAEKLVIVPDGQQGRYHRPTKQNIDAYLDPLGIRIGRPKSVRKPNIRGTRR